jgi:PAS domain S-box-containing protein
MKDENKTKTQLIQEIAALRQRVAELEASSVESQQAKETLQQDEALLGTIVEAVSDTDKRKLIENQLQQAYEELEQRVAERTAEIRKANKHLENQIAERKQIEKKLREAEKRYRTLFEQSPDAIMIVDPETTLPIVFNDVLLRLLGYSREAFAKLPVSDYEVLESPEEVEAHAQKILRQGHDTFETKLRTKTGAVRDVLVNIQKIELSGRVVFHNIIRDITEQKQAEKILKQSEERLRAQYEGIPMPTYTWQRVEDDFMLIDYNQAAAAVTRGGVETVMGITLSEMYKDLPEVIANFWRCFNERTSIRQEMIYHFRSMHEEKYLTVHYVFVPPDLVMIHTDDITERRQAEETLKKLSSVVEQTADQVLIADHNGIIEYVNPAFERMTGYSQEEVIGQTPRFLNSGRHTPSFFQALWQTIRAGQVFRGTIINQKKNGELYYEEKTITPLKDQQGNITHFVSTSKDITERKELEERLAAIYQLGQELTFLYDETAIIQRTLETATKVLQFKLVGCSLADEVTNCLISCYHLVNGKLVLTQVDLPLDDDNLSSMGVTVIRRGQALNVPDLTQNPCYVAFSKDVAIRSQLCVPMKIGARVIGVLTAESTEVDHFSPADQQLLQTLATQTAVALENARLYEAKREQYRRLQQSQAQLIRVEKMAALGRLVASIAHEINNPIQAVQNCLALTKERLEEASNPEKLNFYMDLAKNELDRVSTIISRMRNFYRPTGQSDSLDPASIDDFYRLSPQELQPVKVHNILEELLQLVNKQLQHNQIIIKLNWAGNLPVIEASVNQLKQVFLNLILNAIDAMDNQGGSLSICTKLDQAILKKGLPQSVVRIEFKDTGTGMSPEVLSRIFEPLFTTKAHGSGFGLFTTYKIIEAHQGQITVASQVGLGTTFTILLPLKQC